MTRTPRHRFWLEVVLALASSALLLGTLVWRDWIELVFPAAPDHHGGSLEWLIVAVTLAVAVASSLATRFEWRRAAVATPAEG